ncbi:MAG: hypothetical protein WCG85_28045 [Polyangia bacterium]
MIPQSAHGLLCALVAAGLGCGGNGRDASDPGERSSGLDAGGQPSGVIACPNVGCSTVAELRTQSLTTSLDQARIYEVRFCRNQNCGTAALANLDTSLLSWGGGVGLSLSLPAPGGDDRVSITLWNESGAFQVEATWDAELSTHADGDVFLLDVTDPSGASVASITKVATYETYTPNGEACGPVCFRAVLADSAP